MDAQTLLYILNAASMFFSPIHFLTFGLNNEYKCDDYHAGINIFCETIYQSYDIFYALSIQLINTDCNQTII